jgi:hypothetical protein
LHPFDAKLSYPFDRKKGLIDSKIKMYASLRALYLIIWEEYLRKFALAPCKKVESDAFGTWTVRPKKGVPHHQKMLLNNATYLQ